MDLKSINKLKKTYETWTVIGIVLVVISFIGFMANPLMMIGFIAGGLISAIASAKFKKLSTEFKSIHVKKIIEQVDDWGKYKNGFLSKLLEIEKRFFG